MTEPSTARAWRARDLAEDTSWLQHWSSSELEVLEQWAGQVDAAELAESALVLDQQLPSAPPLLVARAAAVRSELIAGRGLTVLSGFDASGPNLVERAGVAFLLFSRLIGSLRCQNGAGHLLGHVTDIGADAADPTTRIYQTNRRQTFHTDSTDAVGLLCLRGAKSGGKSMVVNVEAVYEQMCDRAPDLAQRMFDPVATDRRGEQPEGAQPWFEVPVLSRSGDRITGLYQRQYIDSASRFDDAPVLDDQQIKALDLFDQIMNDPKMHVTMQFNPGDMQFVHNHSVLHDRTGFIDHDDLRMRRHLLRVWLSLPGDRELPSEFAQRYGTTTVGDRGGIVVAGASPTISFKP